jgi:starch synthase (maltosyl-transferring)
VSNEAAPRTRQQSPAALPRNPATSIYNLFPLLAGPFTRWSGHMTRAAELGFTWLFINPVHRPGESGSLYSIADYFAFNPLLVDAESPLDAAGQAREAIRAAERMGLRVLADLVVNHCAADSELVRRHPEWFVWEAAGRVAHPFAMDAGQKVVWTDLARFDHERSRDKEGLFRYFGDVVTFLIDLGFKGFRCDAAYQVPRSFWERLIRETKARHPDVVFLAETLGSPLTETKQTAAAGFDYIFNSSKWWDFSSPWLMEQYMLTRQIAPSVSFPESHDTPRLFEEMRGNAAGLRQRYLFAALFSAGVMMPVGFEYGFRRKLHVVETRPADWEEPSIDLTAFIREVNRIKSNHGVFQEEAITQVLPYGNPRVLLMWKASSVTSQEALLILNADTERRQLFSTRDLRAFVQSGAPLVDRSPGGRLDYLPSPFSYELEPGQGLVLVTPGDTTAARGQDRVRVMPTRSW